MIGKASYTLQCSGCIQAFRLAEILHLFAAQHINIQKLSLLPPLESSQQARLELTFDLPAEKELFFEALQQFLCTLSDCQPLLQPV